MTFRRVAVLLASAHVVVTAAAACGRSGSPGAPDGAVPAAPAIPLPFGFDAGLGDGRDGTLVVSGTVTRSDCRPLIRTTAGTGVVADFTGPPLDPAPGDLLLLWQVQAPFAVEGEAAVTSLDSAGRWQIARLLEVEGPLDAVVLRTDPAPASDFRSGGGARAQVCRIPQFDHVTIEDGGILRTEPWNGGAGGFLGFFARGVVELEAGGRLDASAAGFRGAPETCVGTGPRGEGLDPALFGLEGGDAFANAGGGGTSPDHGGGGGSAAGRGGQGANEDNNQTVAARGKGGVPILVPARESLVLGGGGGGGGCDGGNPAFGGPGGGVVFVRAAHLRGAGAIRANGGAGENPGNNGGGGGGGGGTIVLDVLDASAFTGGIRASGGSGGTANDDHGPGGGGGGGRVWLVLPSLTVGTAAVPGGPSPLPVGGGLLGSASEMGVVEIGT